MKPKRHYTQSSWVNIFLVLLLITIGCAAFFLPLKTMIYIIVIMFPLALTPLFIQSYVFVSEGSIYQYSVEGKYTLSGKPMKEKGPSSSIRISDISKIEKITKNNQLKGFLIYVSYYSEPIKIRSKTAQYFLKEILAVNEGIKVI